MEVLAQGNWPASTFPVIVQAQLGVTTGQGPFAVSLRGVSRVHVENERAQLPQQGLRPCWRHGKTPIPVPVMNTARDVTKLRLKV